MFEETHPSWFVLHLQFAIFQNWSLMIFFPTGHACLCSLLSTEASCHYSCYGAFTFPAATSRDCMNELYINLYRLYSFHLRYNRHYVSLYLSILFFIYFCIECYCCHLLLLWVQSRRFCYHESIINWSWFFQIVVLSFVQVTSIFYFQSLLCHYGLHNWFCIFSSLLFFWCKLSWYNWAYFFQRRGKENGDTY